ncbi:MAG: HAD family hydrolase [Candidatus Verstraetearchaeota archaeon]|nr:HAD family hydrolase [Candidatus Verstraetearchaeota archaeon]
MISAVLFDLDGTLIDCIIPMERILVRVLENLGIRTAETKKKYVVENLRKILLQGSSPFDGFRLLWRLGRFLGMPPHKRAVMMLFAYRSLKEVFLNSPLFPGAKQVLEDLKRRGIVMGIVTTRSAKEAVYVLKRHSIDEYFEIVVSRDLVNRGKPHPDPIIFALRKMGISPAQAVMVGDMPTDIEAGKAAGAKTIALAIGIFNDALRESGADVIASSLQDIPCLIDSL